MPIPMRLARISLFEFYHTQDVQHTVSLEKRVSLFGCKRKVPLRVWSVNVILEITSGIRNPLGTTMTIVALCTLVKNGHGYLRTRWACVGSVDSDTSDIFVFDL